MSTTALQMLYITSCTDPLMWYADRVGQFVPLMRRLPEGGWLSQEPGGHSNIVHKLDAEEVTVFVSRPKMGQWPRIQPRHKLVHIVRKDVAERLRAVSDGPVVLQTFPVPPGSEGLSGSPLTAQAQCLDLCMLGSCKGLGDCQESAAWLRLSELGFAEAEREHLARKNGTAKYQLGTLEKKAPPTNPNPHPSAIKAAFKAAASMWARVIGKQP